MNAVVKYPDSTKTSLQQRLTARARQRWPEPARVEVRHRANFSYVDAVLPDGTILKLCRLRYNGSARVDVLPGSFPRRRLRAGQVRPRAPGSASCLLYTSDAADEEDSVDL